MNNWNEQIDNLNGEWKGFTLEKKVHNTRSIKMLLEVELFIVDLLYKRIADLEIRMYDLERQNGETFSFLAGEFQGYNSEQNEWLRMSRKDLNFSLEEWKQEIYFLTVHWMSLSMAEISKMRLKQQLPKISAVKRRKVKRGSMSPIF